MEDIVFDVLATNKSHNNIIMVANKYYCASDDNAFCW